MKGEIKVIRKIIKIDQEKCNGCGLCITACHEGALALVDGKAKLLRDDYCDGLGDCLPACPTGAISFEEREAAAFDEQAVKRHLTQRGEPLACGCPGSMSRAIDRAENEAPEGEMPAAPPRSMLSQWPVQIKLIPVRAPYLDGANLLVAADCSAYAYADFHRRFIKNRVVLIGCPKLDEGDYADKLTEILTHNDIKSVTVVRMEVPCCGGIENAVKTALINSGKLVPWQVVTVSIDGEIIEN